MTNKEYAKQYRAEGYGASCDARYRARHIEEIRRKDRERKRLLRALKKKRG